MVDPILTELYGRPKFYDTLLFILGNLFIRLNFNL